jgi:phage protein D
VSLSRPSALLTVDGRTLTAAEAALVGLSISLGLAGTHDPAEVMLWPSSKLADVTPGARMSISLGPQGDEQEVWGGEVTAVAAGADGVVLDGLASTVALSRHRLSQTFLDRSVADVVRDLASAAGAEIDQVEGDTHLPAYAVDDRRPVWEHLVDLARLFGADLGASPGGALRFVPAKSGSADWTLTFGADLVAWSGGAGAPAPDAPAVGAHGAASESGAEQWHWLLRTPTPAGDSSTGGLRIPGAVRTRDAAEVAGRAFAGRAGRAVWSGRFETPGRPDVRPGDLLRVDSLPAGDPGTLRVKAVAHRLDARQGFRTILSVEATGEALL